MIGQAIVNSAKRLPIRVDMSKIRPGDRIKFKVTALYRTRATIREVLTVKKDGVEVDYQRQVFFIYPGEIIEHYPKEG